jgi:hypothetical protein
MSAAVAAGTIAYHPMRVWQRSPLAGSIDAMLAPENEQRAVLAVAVRLAAMFPGLPPDAVQDTVRASHNQFAGSSVRDFIPILVERTATASLRARMREAADLVAI